MALKDLTINYGEVQEKQIERIVSPYVRYDEKQGLVIFNKEGRELSIDLKILVYLIARKGWQFFDFKRDEERPVEESQPKEIAENISENRSTVRRRLMEIKNDGWVYKTTGGGYVVPNHMLDEAEKLITRETERGVKNEKRRYPNSN